MIPITKSMEGNNHGLIHVTTDELQDVVMGQQCQMCSNPAYDDCVSCKRPTCKHHGKKVGDHFVCKKCADKFR